MSATKQGFYSRIKLSPNVFRYVMNCWPPFLGLRVHIESISPDWQHLRVRMKLGLRNKNYVGTHFGGGLFTMTDPFFMVMFVNLIGRDFLVWDKSAKIDFVAPGRSTVFAQFDITPQMLADIHAATAGGEKFEPTYEVKIVDASGALIARVEKTLYFRARRPPPG